MKDDIIKLDETSSLVSNNAHPLSINAKEPSSSQVNTQAAPADLPFQGKANRRLKLKKPKPEPEPEPDKDDNQRTTELVVDKDSVTTFKKFIGLSSRIKRRVMLVFLMILILLYFFSRVVLFLKCNFSSHGIVLKRPN